MLGRVVFFGVIAPFGLAFLSACMAFDKRAAGKYAVVALSGIAGAALSGTDISIIRYSLAYVMYGLVYVSTTTLIEEGKNISEATMATIAIFLSGVIFYAQKGFDLYNFIMLLLDSMLCGVCAYMMLCAIPAISGEFKSKVLLPSELTGVIIVLSLCVFGISDITIGQFSVGNAAAAALIMLCALCCDVSGSVMCGAALGLIYGITKYPMTEIIGAFSLCGLVSGMLRRFNKPGVILAFFVTNTTLSLYSGGAGNGVFSVLEFFAAIIILFFIPSNTIDAINELVGSTINSKTSDSVKFAIQKLKEVGQSFASLAKTFSDSIKPEQNENLADITTLFDKTADRVCKKCGLRFVCWEKQFNTTYDAIMKLAPVLAQNGKAKTGDLGQPFRSRCIKGEQFVSELNKIYALHKLDMQRHQKSAQSKELAKEQFAGMSQIIDSLIAEIGTGNKHDLRLENNILAELEYVGFKKCEISVMRNKFSRYEVCISVKRCPKKYSCTEKIVSIVSEAVKRQMDVRSVKCGLDNNCNRCEMLLLEKEKFSVCCGVSSRIKNGQTQSGDNYNYLPIDNGKYILVLSDGMGSGATAADKSKTTVAMLRQLLEAGFDKQSTIKIINSVLLLDTKDECFATIDITVLDLFGKDAEFIKIGANSTFIKRGKKILQINSSTLPAGILKEVDIETSYKSIESEDYVIMISDGVQASEGEWLKKYLTNAHDLTPQNLADNIIAQAIKLQNGFATDDMTVIVAKLVPTKYQDAHSE